jgi:hypothetical protein
MNSHNSSANAQKTIPPEYVPPMSLHRFCEITGLSKASAWRYEKRGWLRTHLIANRRYVLAADVPNLIGGSPQMNLRKRFESVHHSLDQTKERNVMTLLEDTVLTSARPWFCDSLLFGAWRGLGLAAAALYSPFRALNIMAEK